MVVLFLFVVASPELPRANRPDLPLLSSPNSLRLIADPEQFMRDAVKNEQAPGMGCGLPEALKAQALLAADDPERGVVGEVLIHGDVSEYLTTNFKILYTKTAGSVDLPPLRDDGRVATMQDGTKKTAVAGNGVPDYVEVAGFYFEYARAKFASLGFGVTSPRLEVRIVAVDRSYSMPLIGITLSSKATDWYLPWLCAHEYFHQVQVVATPGDFGINFINLHNPTYYDTFPLEGTANVGADFVFNTSYGSQENSDAASLMLEEQDAMDFFNQAYHSSVFWKYLLQQHATDPKSTRGQEVGSEVIRTFWSRRGRAFTGTQAAIEETLEQYGGGSFNNFMTKYRIATAVKGHFNADPTAPGPNRAYDWVADGASNWPGVAITKEFKVEEGDHQESAVGVKFDRGAKFYKIVPGRRDSYKLRLIGGSDDIRLHVAQVYMDGASSRAVDTTTVNGKDGEVWADIQVKSGLIATYAVVESLDGEQPFVLQVNPVLTRPTPDISMKCGATVPLGSEVSERDTAAAVQIVLLVAVALLAVRLHRRRAA